jgi:8-oxo-dGTP pyrophosphatase MutT (NUDIX family)
MAAGQKLQELGEVHLCAEAYVIYQGKLLLHRRSKNKKRFPGYLIGPGGHIDEGEDVANAACREIEEETGIIVHPTSFKLKFVAIHHHTDTRTIWVNWGGFIQAQ